MMRLSRQPITRGSRPQSQNQGAGSYRAERALAVCMTEVPPWDRSRDPDRTPLIRLMKQCSIFAPARVNHGLSTAARVSTSLRLTENGSLETAPSTIQSFILGGNSEN